MKTGPQKSWQHLPPGCDVTIRWLQVEQILGSDDPAIIVTHIILILFY